MRADLPAAPGPGPGPLTELTPLRQRREDSCGEWRILELVSVDSPAPFEAHLEWNAGDGAGMAVRIVVPRATRISVFASWIRVQVANRCSRKNTVLCVVTPGYAVTTNQWEEQGVGADGAVEVPIPPFAASFQLSTAMAADLPLVGIALEDGQGERRLGLTADLQPDGGILLGCAHRLTVTAPTGVVWRVVFSLSL